jgi:hypothetical protein
MKDTYSAKEFGKFIGKAVVTLQKWNRKGDAKSVPDSHQSAVV